MVLSVESEFECFLGDDQGWALLNEDACAKLGDGMKKAAKECKDAVFLSMKGDANADLKALSQELGVTQYPTILYYRNGEVIQRTEGASGAVEAVSTIVGHQ